MEFYLLFQALKIYATPLSVPSCQKKYKKCEREKEKNQGQGISN
jgi:hypothetical protein